MRSAILVSRLLTLLLKTLLDVIQSCGFLHFSVQVEIKNVESILVKMGLEY